MLRALPRSKSLTAEPVRCARRAALARPGAHRDCHYDGSARHPGCQRLLGSRAGTTPGQAQFSAEAQGEKAPQGSLGRPQGAAGQRRSVAATALRMAPRARAPPGPRRASGIKATKPASERPATYAPGRGTRTAPRYDAPHTKSHDIARKSGASAVPTPIPGF